MPFWIHEYDMPRLIRKRYITTNMELVLNQKRGTTK